MSPACVLPMIIVQLAPPSVERKRPDWLSKSPKNANSAVIIQNDAPFAVPPRRVQLRPSTVVQTCDSGALRFTPYAGPERSTAIRSKPVSVYVTVAESVPPPSAGPASAGPASAGPASGGPASGDPASGGPASGGPASGVPPSVPPAALLPLTVKSRNQMPARSVHIPAVPAAVTAEAEESFTITFAMPFAEPTSFTGFDPVTDKPMVAHHPRSAIPLGACPSTVTVATFWRLTCSEPFASSATS